MQIPVLIEPIAGNGYLAKTGDPLPLRAEGATRGDALKKLEEMMTQRLTSGSTIAPVPEGASENPWLAMAGIYDPADPEVQAWIEAMAEYRREVDNDPDRL